MENKTEKVNYGGAISIFREHAKQIKRIGYFFLATGALNTGMTIGWLNEVFKGLAEWNAKLAAFGLAGIALMVLGGAMAMQGMRIVDNLKDHDADNTYSVIVKKP